MALVEAEVTRLRSERPEVLRAMASDSPLEAERDGIAVTTYLTPESDRVMVLVEAWRGRRVLATGGFAMHADGSAHTPH